VRLQAETGKAVVFSSHQLDLVESLCDDVVIVDEGRDVLAGELQELKERSDQRHVEIGFAGEPPWSLGGGSTASGELKLTVPADADIGRLLHTALEAGEISRFAFQPPRLSELFREAVAR
jgi:ABC-2 type transport system ATP-binding protein